MIPTERTLTVTLDVGDSGIEAVRSGLAPTAGEIGIATETTNQQFDLTLFVRSVEQLLEAVDAVRSGSRGAISLSDTTYAVAEPAEEGTVLLTTCYSKAAVENPAERTVEPEDRPLHLRVDRDQFEDAVFIAVEELLDDLRGWEKTIDQRSWYRDLRATLEDLRGNSL